MASLKFYLDCRRALSDGSFPLKLSVSHRNLNLLLSTGVTLPQKNWDQLLSRVVLHPNRRALNFYLDQFKSNVQNRLLDLVKNSAIECMDAVSLKKALGSNGEHFHGQINPEDPGSLSAYFQRHASDSKSARTSELYLCTLKKINDFVGSDSLSFSDVNISWLRSFDSWMANSGIKTNSRAIHMRNLRAVFNDALDDDLITSYPFRKFKIRSEKTRKRSLSVFQLADLRDCLVEPHQERYRSLFMLIFYLIGINFVDLCGLDGIVDGRVEYRRHKTGRLYSIKVEPEAKKIIESLRGKNHLIFVNDSVKNYKNFMKEMNDSLKLIGVVTRSGLGGRKSFKPYFPNLSTYWARHTWATLAAELDVPKDTIAAALGHGGDGVTDVYIDFDRKKIDEANRRVIDYLNSSSLLKRFI